MITEIYIQGQKLDLYEDETISVKQVSKDLKDISKIFADYSQTFNVPASKTNNQIFSNWYDANIDNGFDARTRVEGIIRLNTLDFKLGKFRLDGADIKHNQPRSYRLTFFGNTIKVKDLLGEDELNDLEWLDNFNHNYNGDVVKDGLIDGLDFTVDGTLYGDAIIYPLISYQRQWFYNSDASDDTGTDELVNIAYASGKSNGIKSSNLKPAIPLYIIILAIQEQYPELTFNSPFFRSQYFTKIYVNLNKSNDILANGFKLVETQSGTTTYTNPLKCRYFVSLQPNATFEDVEYKIRLTVNGNVEYESPTFLSGNVSVDTGDVDYDNEYDIKFEVITQTDFEFDANTLFRIYYIQGLSLQVFDLPANFYTGEVINLVTDIRSIIPDIKVYEFLTNLFKIFNLVAYANDDGEVVVEDLQSWYTKGEIYDLTKWIDLETETVNRGKIYKEISFKYNETEQILAEQFEQANNERYGEFEFRLQDENGNSKEIDGETLEIEALFENPIHERLFDTNTNTQTSVQYTPYFDKDINPISGNFFMFYLSRNLISGNSIGFVNDGTYEQIPNYAYMPSHSYIINSDSFNLNFNAELNEYTYQRMNDTIYKRYYEDYLLDMFSVKRRIYKFKGRLPDYILNILKLNDRIIIKDRRYIINSLSSNLTKREDTFELINDIYEAPLQKDTLNTSILFTSYSNQTNYGLYSGNAQSQEIYYTGLASSSVAAVDTGDGTAFITITTTTTEDNVSFIKFDLDDNETGVNRSVGIQVTDGLKNPTYYITQLGNANIRFDSTIPTIDNTNITFDKD